MSQKCSQLTTYAAYIQMSQKYSLLTTSAAYIQMSQKYCLHTTSDAYIQMHFRLDFFMEANNMNPDQTAPNRAV